MSNRWHSLLLNIEFPDIMRRLEEEAVKKVPI